MIVENAFFSISQNKLKKPYKLSFGTISYFDIFKVTLRINGKNYFGEVVPLNGYNNESVDSIIDFYKNQLPIFIHKSIYDLQILLREDSFINQFAKSAILTAIDFSLNPNLVNKLKTANSNVDFVKAISIDKKIEKEQFNKTIKIKLSGDEKFDCENLNRFFYINSNIENPVRLDANQAYNKVQASILLNHISNSKWKDKIAYLEQPLISGNWDGIGELIRQFPNCSIMLDESIVTNTDLLKCREFNVPFVKLKLYKQGGITELENQIKLANDLGLKIVLGNGVAGLLTNQIENYLYNKYRDQLYGASEANGYLKIYGE